VLLRLLLGLGLFLLIGLLALLGLLRLLGVFGGRLIGGPGDRPAGRKENSEAEEHDANQFHVPLLVKGVRFRGASLLMLDGAREASIS